jgi:hypothetical protein
VPGAVKIGKVCTFDKSKTPLHDDTKAFGPLDPDGYALEFDSVAIPGPGGKFRGCHRPLCGRFQPFCPFCPFIRRTQKDGLESHPAVYAGIDHGSVLVPTYFQQYGFWPAIAEF